MNRIILIGNGFDLAHGLKTSYKHFIDNYWAKTIQKIDSTGLNQQFENDEIKISKSPGGFIKSKSYKDLIDVIDRMNFKIEFKNRFLKIITERSDLNSWVDIENEYYVLLKNTYNKAYDKQGYSITDLNHDFSKIKSLLVEYLKIVESKTTDLDKKIVLKHKYNFCEKVYRAFDFNDFSEEEKKNVLNREYDRVKPLIDKLKRQEIQLNSLPFIDRNLLANYSNINKKNQIKEIFLSKDSERYFRLRPDNILFLNFNYTFTDEDYHDPNYILRHDKEHKINVESLHIHGSIYENDNNPIIFGFGDELDEDYKSIEKLDNEYLENVKSIRYLDSDNYKRMLEFINSNTYQVYIFGHSCGTSDRTLLNTIFEHNNCASIKLFYHKKNEEDNYSDVIRNISRNFNDKIKMRDIVVNKTYCEPLS